MHKKPMPTGHSIRPVDLHRSGIRVLAHPPFTRPIARKRTVCPSSAPAATFEAAGVTRQVTIRFAPTATKFVWQHNLSRRAESEQQPQRYTTQLYCTFLVYDFQAISRIGIDSRWILDGKTA